MISYDIVDDKVRSQVFNCLKNYGEPVQYSMFECYLTKKNQGVLREALQAFIDATEDSVRWYPVCRWCQKEINVLGTDKITEDKAFYIV